MKEYEDDGLTPAEDRKFKETKHESEKEDKLVLEIPKFLPYSSTLHLRGVYALTMLSPL